MLDKFNEQEVEEIIRDLKKRGYSIKTDEKRLIKCRILAEEAKKFGIVRVTRLCDCQSIYQIADDITDNYTTRIIKNGQRQTIRNLGVPPQIEEDYRKILRGILEAIAPYYDICNERAKRKWGIDE